MEFSLSSSVCYVFDFTDQEILVFRFFFSFHVPKFGFTENLNFGSYFWKTLNVLGIFYKTNKISRNICQNYMHELMFEI